MLELSLHGQSLEIDSLSAALLDRESPMLKWLSTYLPRSHFDLSEPGSFAQLSKLHIIGERGRQYPNWLLYNHGMSENLQLL